MKNADIAQSVERILGKDEVTSSNLVISSMQKGRPKGASFLHCVVETDLIASGSPTRPARWGEEESRREQEGDFKKKSPSASTADEDEVISSMKKGILDEGAFFFMLQDWI